MSIVLALSLPYFCRLKKEDQKAQSFGWGAFSSSKQAKDIFFYYKTVETFNVSYGLGFSFLFWLDVRFLSFWDASLNKVKSCFAVLSFSFFFCFIVLQSLKQSFLHLRRLMAAKLTTHICCVCWCVCVCFVDSENKDWLHFRLTDALMQADLEVEKPPESKWKW